MSYQMTAADNQSTMSRNSDMPSVGSAMQYRLPRPGARPLVFSGTELAMAMSFTPEIPYWYEINIYRSNDQGFVLAIRQFFQSVEEKDSVKAWSLGSLEEIFEKIEQYDAGDDVRMPMIDLSKSAPAELAATAMELTSRVKAARQHFSGLVGELLLEIEAAGNGAI